MEALTLILFVIAGFVFWWGVLGLIKPGLMFQKTRRSVGKIMLGAVAAAVVAVALNPANFKTEEELATQKVEAEAERLAKDKADKEATELAAKEAEAVRLAIEKADKEAEAERLAKGKAAKEAEAERLAKEEADKKAAEAERLAKDKADKEAAELAAKEAEAERLAKDKADKEAEAERLAKEEADKKAAEAERLAKDKADKEAAELAAKEAEAERLAKDKADKEAEAERLAKDKTDKEAEAARLATEKADSSKGKLKKKPGLWYEGGTLHASTGKEWRNATHENKVATAADFIARVWQKEMLVFRIASDLTSMDKLKPYAEELVIALDKGFEKTEGDPAGSMATSEIAVALMMMMQWVKS